MTDRRRPTPRPGAMIAGGLALFLTLLVVLAWQVRSGRDPALGAARQQPALVAQAPRRVVVRKVVRRVILEKVVEPDDGGGTAVAVVPAGTSVQVPPQVVYAAPAPAPAPAPSAPIVTKTS